jgi:hypothetical protein
MAIVFFLAKRDVPITYPCDASRRHLHFVVQKLLASKSCEPGSMPEATAKVARSSLAKPVERSCDSRYRDVPEARASVADRELRAHYRSARAPRFGCLRLRSDCGLTCLSAMRWRRARWEKSALQ